MFEGYTDRALRVVRLARGEAYRRRSAVLGDEHLLAALLAEGGGVGGKALTHQGVGLERFWRAVDELAPPIPSLHPPDPLPFTPRAQRILDEAAACAASLEHPTVGTEHLLLSLLKDREGTAARALERLGIDLGTTRDWVLEVLGAKR
jgi:ATP-dependent Clp protease ATP-binding subunit ClpC